MLCRTYCLKLLMISGKSGGLIREILLIRTEEVLFTIKKWYVIIIIIFFRLLLKK